MKVCLVGGIFGKPQAYRKKHALTPETILAENLRSRGVIVDTVAHAEFVPSDRYDVVHVHHLAAGAITMAAWTGRVPFVFTTHDPVIWTGYEKSLFRRMAHRYVLRQCDALVALSEREARYLTAFVQNRIPVTVIPNGIPAERFPQNLATHRPTDRPRRLLFVGQLVPFKGVDVLFHALCQVSQTAAVELILVYQNAHLEQHYRDLARQLGVLDKVRFVGFLGVEELAAMYGSVDILVLPSYGECLPSVITEAFLCGLPVVATNVGGIPDQVGPYGRIVPPGDPGGLSAAILATLEEIQHGDARRHDRRAYAEQTFNVASMTERHLELYETVIKAKHRSTTKVDTCVGTLVQLLLRAYMGRHRNPVRVV